MSYLFPKPPAKEWHHPLLFPCLINQTGFFPNFSLSFQASPSHAQAHYLVLLQTKQTLLQTPLAIMVFCPSYQSCHHLLDLFHVSISFQRGMISLHMPPAALPLEEDLPFLLGPAPPLGLFTLSFACVGAASPAILYPCS